MRDLLGDRGQCRRVEQTVLTVAVSRPPAEHLLNRELSWLDFNARVLHEAEDERTPLLERLKFTAIVSRNLDEFFMVRVAGLRRQLVAGVASTTNDGMSAEQQLEAIERRVRELTARQLACLHDRLLPVLARHGVRLVGMHELTPGEWASVDAFFETQVFPVLTPLAIDPGQPFPAMTNLALCLAVELRDPEAGTSHFARVKVPKALPRWVPLERTHHFVPMEHVIGANLGQLFPGMDVVGWYAFRITRYTDLDLGSLEDPDDLLAAIEEQIVKRRFAEVVRVEVQDDMPEHVRSMLMAEVHEDVASTEEWPIKGPPLALQEVQAAGMLLDLGDLMELACLPIAELRDPPHTPIVPAELRDPQRSMFDLIRERDLLVHHPYDSFPASVERFVEEAADDEHVLAIKLTLYRTSGDTAIVRALARAAMRGKQVAVLVELKARFDETNNITWARTLEDCGVQVTHGDPALKTHAKTVMVVRREDDGLRRYVHIGTGNYNSNTSRIYADIGYFTARPSIGADVSDLFNQLTGYSRQRLYRKLLVAPVNMRARVLELIARETENARGGRPSRIIAKMNALVDAEVVQALYDASRAGVEIDLLVRGICCLRPGLAGVSDRIRVRSIIGRFLEHSRLWYFANGGAGEYYLGSADWMPRNLDRRVEVVVPVEDPVLHERLMRLLGTTLADNRQAWELGADGRWRQRRSDDAPEIASHGEFIRESWGLETSTGPPQISAAGVIR